MIEIITEREQWGISIDLCKNSDFYHTYDYHQLSKNQDEEPVLIKYSLHDFTILLPLLIRKIEGTTYKDATSVYGYPGPLVSNLKNHHDLVAFKMVLEEFFLENKIVSVFSRLNPYIPHQERVLQDMGEIVTCGKVINIDLTKDLDTQYQAYQKRLRTYIHKARRLCTIKKGSTKEDILKFMEIYYDNMYRVNAKDNYFFDLPYFDALLKSDDYKSELMLTIHNESQEVIAGAIFIKKGNIVQYHLSGTKEEYLYLNPVKLMIDEMRIQATNENYSYINLGGGVGSNEDSLFQFKSSFSKDYKEFKVWKYIVNESFYTKLIEKKEERDCSLLDERCKKFFPSYRCDL